MNTRSRMVVVAVAGWLLTAGAAHAQRVVDVAAGFTNPTTLDGFKGKATISPDRLQFTHCDGHLIDKPVAVLNLARPMKRLQLSAPGAAVLVVKIGTAFVCQTIHSTNETPTVLLDDWQAGTYEIYVGEIATNRVFSYSLRLEDLTRPADSGWASTVPHLKLAAAPTEPIIMSPAQAGPRREGPRGDCRMYNFSEQPDVILEVSAPVIQLEVTATFHDPAPSVMLIGPVPADHREIPTHCMADPGFSRTFPRLEPGLYAIKVGGRAKTAPTVVNLVLRGPDAKRDPLVLAPKIADQLELTDRDLDLHFPLVQWEDIEKRDTVRAGLYAAAPKSLFVFVKRDLELASAELVTGFTYTTSGKDEWPKGTPPAVEPPKQGEPVLLIGSNFVLTADGLLFKVNPNDLSATAVGALSLPAAPRTPRASSEQSYSNAGPEDSKVIEAQRKQTDAYNACVQRVWAPAGKRISAIEQGPYHADNDRRIAAIRSATDTAAHSTCKTDAWEAGVAQTWMKLIDSRTKRRAIALTAAKARLAGLFN